MTAIQGNLPVFIIIAPLFVGFIFPTIAKKQKLLDTILLGTEALFLVLAVIMAASVLTGESTPYLMGGWSAPWGIQLVADDLAAFFALVVAVVSFPVVLYASGHTLEEEVGGPLRRARFFTLLFLLVGALAGIAFTHDMFNVFVLVEVVTISCCGLVSASRRSKAVFAAFDYLILVTLASVFILAGIGFIYIVTGHLNMEFAHQVLMNNWLVYPHVVWLAFSFLLVGFGLKSALFPLHVWLPDAHGEAPSPASAVLSGLAVKGYIVCLIKFLFVVMGIDLIKAYMINTLLFGLGMVAILAGAVLALNQTQLKRRLAFSTVSQIGYFYLGLGLLNVTGLAGTLFYLASHALTKACLFLCSGVLIEATGKHSIKDLAGVGKKMPITMGIFTVASLSLVGIPLFSGFVGKWNILLGCLQEGSLLLGCGVVTAGSILCGAYMFPIIRIAFFEPAPEQDLHDPGIKKLAALGLLALAIVVLGVFPGPLLELAQRAAETLLAQL
jgi:multicomponent Na+:H+ antiporter subunit D